MSADGSPLPYGVPVNILTASKAHPLHADAQPVPASAFLRGYAHPSASTAVLYPALSRGALSKAKHDPDVGDVAVIFRISVKRETLAGGVSSSTWSDLPMWRSSSRLLRQDRSHEQEIETRRNQSFQSPPGLAETRAKSDEGTVLGSTSLVHLCLAHSRSDSSISVPGSLSGEACCSERLLGLMSNLTPKRRSCMHNASNG